MDKGYHKGHDLTMADSGLSLEELMGQPLELLACEGARLVLTVALEEEVTEYLQRGRYERSQYNQRGYRNGHRSRRVTSGAGEIEVAMPRLSDTRRLSAPGCWKPGGAAASWWRGYPPEIFGGR